MIFFFFLHSQFSENLACCSLRTVHSKVLEEKEAAFCKEKLIYKKRQHLIKKSMIYFEIFNSSIKF